MDTALKQSVEINKKRNLFRSQGTTYHPLFQIKAMIAKTHK